MTPAARVRRRATLLVAVAACVLPTLGVLAAPVPGGSSSAAPGRTLAPAAHLPPPPGSTSRASVGAKAVQATGRSTESRISANGLYVAFASDAPNLVTGDTNNARDVFIRDLQSGTTERIPLPRNQQVPAGGRADQPSISGNGEFVAFRYRPPTTATAAVQTRVLLWQRGKGTAEIAADMPSSNRREPSISPDGTWVAFTGTPPPSAFTDSTLPAQVYAWNRGQNQTVLVSANVRGSPGNGPSGRPSIANGGTYVAFESSATSLATDPNPQGQDVFVRSMANGGIALISTRPGGSPGASPAPADFSEQPAISADGAFVVFSTSLRLTGQDTNAADDVYRWNLQTGAYELVSLDASGAGGAGFAGQPAINGDGRYVAFVAAATSTVTAPIPGATSEPQFPIFGESGGATEVYLRDMAVPETIRISVTRNGASAGETRLPSVADDGGRVAFETGNPTWSRTTRTRPPTSSCGTCRRSPARCPTPWTSEASRLAWSRCRPPSSWATTGGPTCRSPGSPSPGPMSGTSGLWPRPVPARRCPAGPSAR
jgi:Tol biopolymer transport system component